MPLISDTCHSEKKIVFLGSKGSNQLKKKLCKKTTQKSYNSLTNRSHRSEVVSPTFLALGTRPLLNYKPECK